MPNSLLRSKCGWVDSDCVPRLAWLLGLFPHDPGTVGSLTSLLNSCSPRKQLVVLGSLQHSAEALDQSGFEGRPSWESLRASQSASAVLCGAPTTRVPDVERVCLCKSRSPIASVARVWTSWDATGELVPGQGGGNFEQWHQRGHWQEYAVKQVLS